MSKLTTPQLHIALEKKYSGVAWAFFSEVRNCTGFRRTLRTADALAFGLWPSRGLELEGFEIKASRSDWLSELKKPAKAEAICAYCDRWWVVVGDKDIVKGDELPPTWGLMIPHGKSVKVAVKAPKLEPKALDRGFLASIIRRLDEARHAPELVEAKIQQAHEEGVTAGKQQIVWQATQAKKKQTDAEESLAIIKNNLHDFERAAGIRFDSSFDTEVGTKTGKAVRLLRDAGRLSHRIDELKREARQHSSLAAQLDECATKLAELGDEPRGGKD